VDKQRVVSLALPVTLCVVAAVALLALVDGASHALGTIRYVADTGVDGGDCTNPNPACRTIQFAVNAAAPGDLIKVAGGIYDDVSNDSIVNIDKTVTIRGGYTAPGFSDPPDPVANPTTLDARGQGRVVYIVGDHLISPTLEGLRLTNGSTNDLGGGVYAQWAQPVISDCWIYGNVATNGAGLHFHQSDNVQLMGSRVYSNTTSGNGGGVFFWTSHNARVVNTMIVDNATTSPGGTGSGMDAFRSTIDMQHTTIARNHGGGGDGIYIVRDSELTATNTILVSNTIGIRTIRAGEPSTATLTATLWGTGTWANEWDWVIDGTLVTGTRNYWAEPAFVDPDAWDYHIGPGSGAVNRGIDVGVSTDIDGDPRPDWCVPDLGADELLTGTPCRRTYLPLVLRSYPSP
jgi:hypothetical protein